MCGIVGLISAYKTGFGVDEAQMFRDMLVFDSVRGFDSTGVFSVNKHGGVRTLKEASTGATFVTRHAYDLWDTNLVQDGLIAIGHNRAATRGVVNDTNAHPFVVEDKIVLVQNGSYKGSHRHLADVEVDSHAIAIAMSEDDDVEKTLQRVNAAYALVWYNVETKTLHVIRNTERPLFICYLSTGAIAFASEAPFILGAAYRAGIKIKKQPYEIKEGMLCSFTILDNGDIAENYKSIDYKYKEPQRSSVVPFRSHNDACAWAVGTVYEDMTAELYGHNGNVSMPQDVTRDIFSHSETWLQHGNFNYGNEADSNSARGLLRGDDKQVVIEWVDLLPANHRPDCKSWFLIGAPVTPGVAPTPMYYRLLYNTTKDTAQEYVTRPGFWTVNCSSEPTPYRVGSEVFSLIRNVTAMAHVPLLEGIANAS